MKRTRKPQKNNFVHFRSLRNGFPDGQTARAVLRTSPHGGATCPGGLREEDPGSGRPSADFGGVQQQRAGVAQELPGRLS